MNTTPITKYAKPLGYHYKNSLIKTLWNANVNRQIKPINSDEVVSYWSEIKPEAKEYIDTFKSTIAKYAKNKNVKEIFFTNYKKESVIDGLVNSLIRTNNLYIIARTKKNESTLLVENLDNLFASVEEVVKQVKSK